MNEQLFQKASKIYGIPVDKIKELEEVYNKYSVSTKERDSQSYKDWCELYTGIYRESTYEIGFRNWLACLRWVKVSEYASQGRESGVREALEEAVKSFQLIEQMSDPGSYERAVVEMKRIASGAVEKGKAALGFQD